MVHWILVPAFGKGMINNVLAEKTSKEVLRLRQFDDDKVVIFTQRDLENPLQIILGETNSRTITLIAMQSENGYISTGDIVQQFVANLRDQDDVSVIAADPHAYRVMRDLMFSLIDNNLQIPIQRIIFSVHESPMRWFRRLNGQIWTQKKLLWNIRETILLALPWPIYKKC